MSKVQKIVIAVIVGVIILCGCVIGIWIQSMRYSASTHSGNDEPAPTRKVFFTYQIDIGMTENEVKETWGWPDDTDTTKTEHAVYETYIYINFRGDYYFVHFENGKVTSVSEY